MGERGSRHLAALPPRSLSHVRKPERRGLLIRDLPSDFTSGERGRVQVDVGVPVPHQNHKLIERDSRARGRARHENPVNRAGVAHWPIVGMTEALNDAPIGTHGGGSVNMDRSHVSEVRDTLHLFVIPPKQWAVNTSQASVLEVLVSAFQGGVQTGDWIGHGRPPALVPVGSERVHAHALKAMGVEC